MCTELEHVRPLHTFWKETRFALKKKKKKGYTVLSYTLVDCALYPVVETCSTVKYSVLFVRFPQHQNNVLLSSTLYSDVFFSNQLCQLCSMLCQNVSYFIVLSVCSTSMLKCSIHCAVCLLNSNVKMCPIYCAVCSLDSNVKMCPNYCAVCSLNSNVKMCPIYCAVCSLDSNVKMCPIYCAVCSLTFNVKMCSIQYYVLF